MAETMHTPAPGRLGLLQDHGRFTRMPNLLGLIAREVCRI